MKHVPAQKPFDSLIARMYWCKKTNKMSEFKRTDKSTNTTLVQHRKLWQ